MDFGNMLIDAFSYMKEGVWGDTNRWLKLILALILLGFPFSGYIMRIYRGTTTAPEVDQWGTLFVDGLKLFVVGLVYAIPLLVLWVLIYGSMFLAIASGSMDGKAMATFEPNFVLMILFYIVELAVVLIMPVASIRFARTGSFSEAFNFSAITGTIGRIGWLSYVVALFLVSIVVSIPIFILVFGFIFVGAAALVLFKESALFVILGLLVLGILLFLIISPLIGVFQARYMTRLYDSAIPPAAPEQ
jgi:hypothetical protein